MYKRQVKKRGIADNFYIASAATSSYEIGNSVHRGTRTKLAEYGISAVSYTHLPLCPGLHTYYNGGKQREARPRGGANPCLLYTSREPRRRGSR